MIQLQSYLCRSPAILGGGSKNKKCRYSLSWQVPFSAGAPPPPPLHMLLQPMLSCDVLSITCLSQQWLLSTDLLNNVCIAYTARNATDLLQVVELVDFTSLLQVVNKFRSSKSVDSIKMQQVCENQTCCNLIFADFLQVAETTCIKLVDRKSQLSTCIKPRLVDNLQQTCYHQTGASDANAS